MKKIYYLFFILMYSNSSSADWELFALNQKSYFSYQDAMTLKTNIESVCMDTIVSRNGVQLHFFNRDYLGVNGNCYTILINTDGPANIPYNLAQPQFDSLTVSGDTVFYDPALYFLPLSSPGQSWNMGSHLVTCLSIDTATFFGISDSVKTFSCTSGYPFILSKHHGFISYNSFASFSQTSLFKYDLAGLSDFSGSYGFQKPTYLDFLPYHVGDVLYWEHYFLPYQAASDNWYQQDSITSISFGPDTIEYYYDSWKLTEHGVLTYATHARKIFVVANMINTLESPTNWISFSSASAGGGDGIFGSGSYILEQDSSITYHIFTQGHYLYNCSLNQIPDDYTHETYNTKQGLIHWGYDAFFPIYDILVGSKINGVMLGDTTFNLGVDDFFAENNFNVFPNLASDKINIKLPEQSVEVSIYNQLGISVYKSVTKNMINPIDISSFPSSMYVVCVKDRNGLMHGRKFIKTD